MKRRSAFRLGLQKGAHAGDDMGEAVATQMHAAIPARHHHDVIDQPRALQHLQDDRACARLTVIALLRAAVRQRIHRIVGMLERVQEIHLAGFAEEVDEVVCPFSPEFFTAIGRWYVDFSQVSDREVLDLLQRAWLRQLPEEG